MCCDYCHNSVCEDCIQRIGGKDYLGSLLHCSDEEKWKCFSCNTKFLRSYEQFYFQNSEANNISKNCNNTVGIPVEVEEVEFSESFGRSDVSGIATDEVSMSDTELCINKEENHFHKPSSNSSHTDTLTSKMPLCNISSNKRKKCAFVDMLSDSSNSTDDMAEQHNKVTLLSDDEQDIIQPINHDASDLPSPLDYTVRSSDEHASSDSDLIAPKLSKSFRKNLVSESSQTVSPSSSDNEEKANLKWYSTRSKAYKGNELNSSAKFSSKKRKRWNVKVLSSESDSDPDNTKPLTPGRNDASYASLLMMIS